jgi:sugar diacid utilization regulator
LAGELLGRRDGDPGAAAAEILSGGFLSPVPAYGVLYLRAFHAAEILVPDAVRVRLVDAAEQLRRAVAPHHLLVLVTGDAVVGILACGSSSELERRGGALAEAASGNLEDSPGWTPLVGAAEGATVDVVPRVHEEAQQALQVGHALGPTDGLVLWSDLGAYRTLARLLGDRSPLDLLPEPLRRLLASPDADTLIPTLERFLDLGGNARGSAEELHLHRSSLYGRLHRIEEIAGVDLRSGEDRLEMHLGLRLWHLAGWRGTKG